MKGYQAETAVMWRANPRRLTPEHEHGLKQCGPFLNRDEERELALRMLDGDVPARNQLIEANIRWIVKLAKKYLWSNMPLEDLIQEGVLAFMQSLDRFDPFAGTRVTTWTTPLIKFRLLKVAQQYGPPVRLPSHVASDASQNVLDALLVARHPVAQIDPNICGAVTIREDHAARLDRETERELEQLQTWLDLLPERERFVLDMRLAGETLLLIGGILGVSRERARQIESSALKFLREQAGMSSEADAVSLHRAPRAV